jgi:hypothetical protein
MDKKKRNKYAEIVEADNLTEGIRSAAVPLLPMDHPNADDADEYMLDVSKPAKWLIEHQLKLPATPESIAEFQAITAKYLKRILRHRNPLGYLNKAMRQRLTRDGKRKEELPQKYPSFEPNPARDTAGIVAIKELIAIFSREATPQQKKILDPHLQGFSYAEIADQLGTTENNCMVQLSTLTEKVRNRLLKK